MTPRERRSRLRGLTRAAAVGLGWLVAVGCRPTASPSAPTAPIPALSAGDGAAPAMADRLALAEWAVDPAPDSAVPMPAAALAAAVADRLDADGPFACREQTVILAPPPAPSPLPVCGADVRVAARTGVAVAATALLVDDAGQPVGLDAASQVLLQVRVHAERGGRDGRPRIAVVRQEAPLPLPPSRKGPGLGAFLAPRAAIALVAAAHDAGGQLLAQELPDDGVRAWLSAEAPWQRVAALRELGERGLSDRRPAVEAAARRGRPDVRAVACATLGRLAAAASVPALVEALADGPAEVADAALQALADIGGAAALAAIEAAAADHPLPWIRHKARLLLDAARAPPP